MKKSRLVVVLSLAAVAVLMVAPAARAQDEAARAQSEDQRAPMMLEHQQAQSALADTDLAGLIASVTDPTAEIAALVADTDLNVDRVRLVNVALVPGFADAEDAADLNAALATPGVTSAAQSFLSGSSHAATLIDAILARTGINSSQVLGLGSGKYDRVIVFYS